MKTIVIGILSLFLFAPIISCNAQSNEIPQEEIPHYLKRDNFTVLRILIKNSEDQFLMVNDNGFWGMPWVNFTKKQFLNEAIDSMAMEYGIELSDVELHGQFCFKYDYKPNVTFRNYYLTRHKSGEIKIPKNTIEAKFRKVEWVEIPEAIERLGNDGMKKITQQIVDEPNIVWGGSFMVSHTEDDHPTKLVRDFYPLFKRHAKE